MHMQEIHAYNYTHTHIQAHTHARTDALLHSTLAHAQQKKEKLKQITTKTT